MNKYHRVRDTRKEGGIRMSVSITAASAEEADELFEERWKARLNDAVVLSNETQADSSPTMPVITNESLRDKFMSPGALEIKRRTPVFNQ